MNKIIKLEFDTNGILVNTEVAEIRQGDKGVIVEVSFEDVNNAYFIARINFTRSDEKQNNNIYMNPSDADETKYSKSLDSTWYFEKDGSSTLTVFLTDGAGNQIANGQVTIAVQKTDFSDETSITPEEYEELLEAIANKSNIKDTIIATRRVTGDAIDYAREQTFYEKDTKTIIEIQNRTFATTVDFKRFVKGITADDPIQEENYFYQEWVVADDINREIATFGLDLYAATQSQAGLMSATDKEKIDNMEQTIHDEVSKYGVHKLTKTASGANFETKTELDNATVFYYRGVAHTPDPNDFVIVEKYGEVGNEQPARFSFDGKTWSFDYLLNDLTVEQQEALNSGIDSTKVEKIEANEQAIGELADLVNVIKLYVATKELEDGTEIPDLSDIRQIEPIQKTYSFREIYDAISNKKHVKIVATYQDSQRYFYDISNVSEISITLTLREGIVVDYLSLGGSVTETVHKIGEGGDVPENVETTNNKVTTINSGSTNDEYPSAKAVYDVVQPIKERLEGKAVNYTLSYKTVPPTEQTFDDYVLFKEDGTLIATWQEFQEYIQDKDQCMNSVFGEGKNFIDYADYDVHYMLVSPDKVPGYEGTPTDATVYMILFFELQAEYGKLNNGDNILVIEEYNDEGKYIPDYWYGNYGGFYAFNSSDDRNLAKLNADNTFTGTNTFTNGVTTNQIKCTDTLYIGRNGYYTYTAGPLASNANGSYDLGRSNLKWKDLYLGGSISNGSISIPVDVLIGAPIVYTTTTTISLIMASGKPYTYTQPITSITISGLTVTQGDPDPKWKLSFIAGTGLTSVSLPNGCTWVDGTPTFVEGNEYTILIEPNVTNTGYKVWLIRG